ncbi:MAG: hypothetical protein IPH45_20045 [Bacteroidales bacterium]|nr:hypothetical protein [Bacteroidales bacterium]
MEKQLHHLYSSLLFKPLTSLPFSLKILFVFSILFSQSLLTQAEGTKQLEPPGSVPISPSTVQYGKIYLDNNITQHRVLFAQYNCQPQYRLNIHVYDHNVENIYYGFGNATNYGGNPNVNRYYQIKDPDGVVVTGSLSLLPTTGTGYIPNYNQAIAGPNISGSVPTGYEPLVLDPSKNGDYYIEFSSTASGSQVSGTELKYIDITVAQGTTPINGRVWSKAWQLSSSTIYANNPPGFGVDDANTFSQFYVYSDDGIVTLLDLNGMAGGAFTVYCNQWGVTNTGIWSSDRRSSDDWPASGDMPQYKIFLNDPDSNIYPTGQFGQICDITTESYCNGTIDFIVR